MYKAITLTIVLLLVSVSGFAADPINPDTLQADQVLKQTSKSVNIAQQWQTSGQVLNINTAPADSLQLLPGIGEVKAARIVAARRILEGFETVDDLLQVSGIGDKTLEKLRPFITI